MNDKEKVLKTLKDFGELSTGRLASIIGMNYYKALPLLQEMWEQKLIVGNVEAKRTIWKLKEKKTWKKHL